MPRVDTVQHTVQQSKYARMTMLMLTYELLWYVQLLHRHAKVISDETSLLHENKALG